MSEEKSLNNPFKGLDKSRYRDAREPGRPAPVKVKKSGAAAPGDDDASFAGLMRESGVTPLESGQAGRSGLRPAPRPAAPEPGAPLLPDEESAALLSGETPCAPLPAKPAPAGTAPGAAPMPDRFASFRPAGAEAESAAATLGELGAFAALKAQAKGLPQQREKSAPPRPGAAQNAEPRAAKTAAPPPPVPRAGLQAASPLKAAPARQAAIPEAWLEDAATAAEAANTDAELFASAMNGVRGMGGKGRDVPLPPPARPAVGQMPAADPLRDFLDGKVEFSLEFTDEYLQGHIVGLDSQVINKMKAGEFSSEAHLDLHGLNAAQAWEALVGFFRSAYHKGLRCVLVVPGRGLNSPGRAGILRERLQTWFTQPPFKYVILAFCTALPKHGGAGALYVLLRKQKKSRGKIHWDIIPADADLLD